jgi:cystathionine beta-lyase/cystathionine gamma-synthase
MTSKPQPLQTLCAQFGSDDDAGSTRGIQAAIEQSSLFRLGTAEESDRRLADFDQGKAYLYTRFGNPTVERLAKAIAQLEGGAEALITSSGNAATLTALSIALDGQDSKCVATHPGLYGGSVELLNLFRDTYGVEVIWADPDDPASWEAAIAKASTVFVETPSNPLWKLVDLQKTIQAARRSNATVIVDNTVATPYNQQPLKLEADWVVHSTSKFLNGHSDAIGGAIVSRSPLTARQRAIHRNLGATVNALDAWLILRGMRSFALRMEAHNHNGKRLADWLKNHPKVQQVYYPGMGDESSRELCARQMDHPGAMISFELSGGAVAARKFLSKLRLFINGVSLGGIESLAVQPAVTSHRGMSATEREAAGVSAALIRLSVGTEATDDLITDLDQALAT